MNRVSRRRGWAAPLTGNFLAGPPETLGLDVKRLSLKGLPIDGHEATNMKRLARLHDTVKPRLNVAECPLAMCTCSLAHHLTPLINDQVVLCQAPRCLLSDPLQHHGLGIAASRNLLPLPLDNRGLWENHRVYFRRSNTETSSN